MNTKTKILYILCNATLSLVISADTLTVEDDLDVLGSLVTSGNVGIGVGSPSEALDVSGNIQVDGAVLLLDHSGDIPPISYENE